MKRENLKNVLENIGISYLGREVQILGVILNLQQDTRMGHTVEEIQDMANTILEKRFSRTWIYKCLSNLEEDGFILVNRIDTPNTYSADIESIGKALQTYIDASKREIEKRIISIENEIKFLETLDSDSISQYALQILTGKDIEKKTSVIEGLQNIRTVIIKEMCTGIGEGDILRISARSNVLDLGGRSLHIEKRILEAASEGLEVRALLNQAPFGVRLTEEILQSFAFKNPELMENGLKSGKLKIKLTEKGGMGYTMISLNNEKMLLFLAQSPKPDTVAFITREGNHVIIDDAINSFDNQWDLSQDLSKSYLNMFMDLVKKTHK